MKAFGIGLGRVSKRKRNRNISEADRAAAARLLKIWNDAKRVRKFKQEDVAAEFGWTQGMISQYLNAHAALGVAATLKFARYLGCRPTDIRPDYESLLASDLTQEAIELAVAWQEIPDASYRAYFQKLIAGWSDRKAG